MEKSADAFRTISEVAIWLGVQTHVLRFWESKFSQIKPVKRAGGRRYYRPADMLLIGGIRKLLHDDGLTIKGVQKILREEGIAYVSDMSHPLDEETAAEIDGIAETIEEPAIAPVNETTSVLADHVQQDSEGIDQQVASSLPRHEHTASSEETYASASGSMAETAAPMEEPSDEGSQAEEPSSVTLTTSEAQSEPPADEPSPDLPSFLRPNAHNEMNPEPALETKSAGSDAPTFETETIHDRQQVQPPARSLVVDVPDVPDESVFEAEPSALSKSARIQRLSSAQRDALRPLLSQLAALRDNMASAPRDGR